MSASSRLNVPRAGDIVIYQRDGSAGVCLLSAFQHASELTFHTYDEAIRDANALAATNQVDAWYTVDGQTYQCTARHRRERQPVRAAA